MIDDMGRNEGKQTGMRGIHHDLGIMQRREEKAPQNGILGYPTFKEPTGEEKPEKDPEKGQAGGWAE